MKSTYTIAVNEVIGLSTAETILMQFEYYNYLLYCKRSGKYDGERFSENSHRNGEKR